MTLPIGLLSAHEASSNEHSRTGLLTSRKSNIRRASSDWLTDAHVRGTTQRCRPHAYHPLSHAPDSTLSRPLNCPPSAAR